MIPHMRLEHGGAERGPAGEHGHGRDPRGQGPRLSPVIGSGESTGLGKPDRSNGSARRITPSR